MLPAVCLCGFALTVPLCRAATGVVCALVPYCYWRCVQLPVVYGCGFSLTRGAASLACVCPCAVLLPTHTHSHSLLCIQSRDPSLLYVAAASTTPPPTPTHTHTRSCIQLRDLCLLYVAAASTTPHTHTHTLTLTIMYPIP